MTVADFVKFIGLLSLAGNIVLTLIVVAAIERAKRAERQNALLRLSLNIEHSGRYCPHGNPWDECPDCSH